MKRYSKDHIWVTLRGAHSVQMGITAFAVKRLGEVVSAEWPETGSDIKVHQSIGTVESAKMVTDLYAPLDGRVQEVNPALKVSVGILNQDPEGDGWITNLEIKDSNQLDILFTLEQYQTWINEEE